MHPLKKATVEPCQVVDEMRDPGLTESMDVMVRKGGVGEFVIVVLVFGFFLLQLNA